jgi:hypothetical protein
MLGSGCCIVGAILTRCPIPVATKLYSGYGMAPIVISSSDHRCRANFSGETLHRRFATSDLSLAFSPFVLYSRHMLPARLPQLTDAEIREIKMEYLCRWLHRMGPTMTWLPPRLPWQPHAMLVSVTRASVATRCTLQELREYARQGALSLTEGQGYAVVTLSSAKQSAYESRPKRLSNQGEGTTWSRRTQTVSH